VAARLSHGCTIGAIAAEVFDRQVLGGELHVGLDRSVGFARIAISTGLKRPRAREVEAAKVRELRQLLLELGEIAVAGERELRECAPLPGPPSSFAKALWSDTPRS